MFEGRKLLIATKHSKERVIAPILEEKLGVTCVVPTDFDTDLLGTFTGEIERKSDALTTAREKCLQALEQTGYDLGIASEGSFGPHPTVFFAHADEEILLFIDLKNNLEISVREISLDTNFNATTLTCYHDLVKLVNTVGFPEHAVILKSTEKGITTSVKGIQTWELLESSYHKLAANNSPVVAETDMRAMFNPRRMKVIEKATLKLSEKITSLCPNCQTPGFGIVEAKSGLPCQWCNQPTKSTLSYLYQCKRCDYTSETLYPNHKETEDPMYCDFCNP
ncbi:DUF6671 family protein [Flavobacterium buctense]|uniref:DUF6671 family protein n=1 Tax=Flavobacterium buctense TaxID=1648146 RepID=A0ABU9E449_9FLAO|nr:DUF6671 family protein [Flavobacterium buctense]